MTDLQSQNGRAGSSRARNWGLPVLSGVIGLAMLAESAGLPIFERYTGLGSGFMVAFVGAALALIAVVLAWQVWSGVDFEPEEGEGVDPTAPVSAKGFGLAVAGVAVPVLAFPWLGFPLGAALAYACVTRAYGSDRILFDLVVGFCLSAVTWFAFTKLGVQLGPFMPFGG